MRNLSSWPVRAVRAAQGAPARPLAALLAALVVAGALAIPSTSRAGITVSFGVPSITVTPGTDFDVELVVSPAGSGFNAFDAVVGFDPALLTAVTLSPLSSQDGALMTTACANRFRKFRATADRDSISLILLCSNVSVTGPGTIYRLRFHAGGTPGVTHLSFLPGLHFYDAGVEVLPVSSQDLTVVVGVTTDVPAGPPAAALEAAPNPSRGLMQLSVVAPCAGHGEMVICDLSGRVVRRLGSGWYDAGPHAFRWDGRDEQSRSAPAGRYFARFSIGDWVAKRAITRLH